MAIKIALLADLDQGNVQPVTYELVSAALILASGEMHDLHLVLAGANIQNSAMEIARRTGIHVLAYESEDLTEYNSESLQAAVLEAADEIEPRFILCAHTSRGSDVAPGLAVALNAGCITNVENIRRDDGSIILSRSVFGGKMMMDITPEEGTSVLTIQPGAFKVSGDVPSSAGQVTVVKKQYGYKRIRPRGEIQAAEEGTPITDAEVIVSAGRGIGKQENIELIRRLAGLFSRSAVGGSRSVCDLGWLEYSRQVGITGKTVAPKLYIACGISGASQHIAGMKDSQLVMAINTDPNAAIFSIADYGIVEDLTSFIPLLIEEYEKPTP